MSAILLGVGAVQYAPELYSMPPKNNDGKYGFHTQSPYHQEL